MWKLCATYEARPMGGRKEVQLWNCNISSDKPGQSLDPAASWILAPDWGSLLWLCPRTLALNNRQPGKEAGEKSKHVILNGFYWRQST